VDPKFLPHLGSILQNSISAEDFYSSNFGQFSIQTQHVKNYMSAMDENIGFRGILKPYEITITNLHIWQNFGFPINFGRNSFHQIDPRTADRRSTEKRLPDFS
jgi:hypothetical protein